MDVWVNISSTKDMDKYFSFFSTRFVADINLALSLILTTYS